MNSKIALAGGLTAGVLAAISAALVAGPVTLPYTFTAGTQAKASEVNGNFSAVKTAVDDNDARITVLQTVVTPAGNIVLVPSTPTAGNILKGTSRFIHNFGSVNTFIGVGAGNFTMSGGLNAGIGAGALQSNTTGNANTASGASTLSSNTTGGSNTATGQNALTNNTIGNNNTATGQGALTNNTSGNSNTATGGAALLSNTTGSSNTANGFDALLFNTTGNFNTANGQSALLNNTTGNTNAAFGVSALQANTIGTLNAALGGSALANNTSGLNNTAVGASALSGNTTGGGNIGIGFSGGSNLTTGINNIAIGSGGVAGESGAIRIGIAGLQTAAFIAGIRGVTTGVANAVAVLVDGSGQLGTVSSSRRVKDDIADMGEASGALMKLRPVTFHYKSDKDPTGRTLQYGLVAEEVAKVAPGLVARSADGKIETVYYQFLAPMLLNEVQKQQRTIGAQTVELTQQKLEIAELRQQAARIAVLEREAARMAALLARLEPADKVASTGR